MSVDVLVATPDEHEPRRLADGRVYHLLTATAASTPGRTTALCGRENWGQQWLPPTTDALLPTCHHCLRMLERSTP